MSELSREEFQRQVERCYSHYERPGGSHFSKDPILDHDQALRKRADHFQKSWESEAFDHAATGLERDELRARAEKAEARVKSLDDFNADLLSDGERMISKQRELVARVKELEPFAQFGRDLRDHFYSQDCSFFYGEESEEIIFIAKKAGLMHTAKFDPEGAHKDYVIEDVEPGEDCHLWGPAPKEQTE